MQGCFHLQVWDNGLDLSRKRVESCLWVGDEEFKYVGVLFMNEWKMEQELNKWIDVAVQDWKKRL